MVRTSLCCVKHHSSVASVVLVPLKIPSLLYADYLDQLCSASRKLEYKSSRNAANLQEWNVSY